MDKLQRTYLPAAGHDWALPLYDPLVKLLGGDKARRALLEQAALGRAHRILDIGCGTGTLATEIKRLRPNASVVGLDPDPKALARGRRKAERAGVSMQFDQGFSDELPYPSVSFDRVFSSFMFHHLQPEQKEKTLREVRRVLSPGGSLHLMDFSKHHGKDDSEDPMLTLMSQAGFAGAKKVREGAMLFGLLRMAYYHAIL
jgi:ubiquinone/menaquinone biosynthesis C-methylase UbiE